MNRKHMIWIGLAILGYVLWRKFGSGIKRTVTNATSTVK